MPRYAGRSTGAPGRGTRRAAPTRLRRTDGWTGGFADRAASLACRGAALRSAAVRPDPPCRRAVARALGPEVAVPGDGVGDLRHARPAAAAGEVRRDGRSPRADVRALRGAGAAGVQPGGT